MKSMWHFCIISFCLNLCAYNPKWYNPNIVSPSWSSSDRSLYTHHKHSEDEVALLLVSQQEIDIQVREIKNQIAARQALVNLRHLREKASNIAKDHPDSPEVQKVTASVISQATIQIKMLYNNFNIPYYE